MRPSKRERREQAEREIRTLANSIQLEALPSAQLVERLHDTENGMEMAATIVFDRAR